MSTTIPESIPVSWVSGDLAQWYFSHADYSPADGWALAFRFRLLALTSGKNRFEDTGTTRGAVNQDATVTTSGSKFLVAIAAATAMTPGRWSYQARVSKLTESYTVGVGEVIVLPDFATLSTSFDDRSQYRVIVDRIETALASGSPNAMMGSYTMNNRTFQYRNLAELQSLHSYFLSLANAAEGKGGIRTIKARFTRPE